MTGMRVTRKIFVRAAANLFSLIDFPEIFSFPFLFLLLFLLFFFFFALVLQQGLQHATLTLPGPYISESRIKTKINLNFYFRTSLWRLKSFYEGL